MSEKAFRIDLICKSSDFVVVVRSTRQIQSIEPADDFRRFTKWLREEEWLGMLLGQEFSRLSVSSSKRTGLSGASGSPWTAERVGFGVELAEDAVFRVGFVFDPDGAGFVKATTSPGLDAYPEFGGRNTVRDDVGSDRTST